MVFTISPASAAASLSVSPFWKPSRNFPKAACARVAGWGCSKEQTGCKPTIKATSINSNLCNCGAIFAATLLLYGTKKSQAHSSCHQPAELHLCMNWNVGQKRPVRWILVSWPLLPKPTWRWERAQLLNVVLIRLACINQVQQQFCARQSSLAALKSVRYA